MYVCVCASSVCVCVYVCMCVYVCVCAHAMRLFSQTMVTEVGMEFSQYFGDRSDDDNQREYND